MRVADKARFSATRYAAAESLATGKVRHLLVTGASGFIGRRLLVPGARALVRAPCDFPDTIIGDLLDRRSLTAACAGIDTIFHCAGHADVSSDADSHWRINHEGTRLLLEAAGEAGVKRFVFLSSVKAMAVPGEHCVDEDWPGEPENAYGRSKRAAEDVVLEAGARYGMHVVNLRLAPVYGRGSRGNIERLIRAIRSGWFPRLPPTGNRRSLVHVQDVVDVVRLAAERPEANGRTWIVADSRAYATSEIVETIRRILQAPTYWSVPTWSLSMARCLGPRLHDVERLIGSACYSPLRIERELGWRARVGLEEGLREMLGTAE